MDHNRLLTDLKFDKLTKQINGLNRPTLVEMQSTMQQLHGQLVQFTEKDAAASVSFSLASRVAAHNALQQFAGDDASKLKHGNNSAEVAGAVANLMALHAKLKASSDGRSGTQHVEAMVVQDALSREKQLHERLLTLGVYRSVGHLHRTTLNASVQRLERSVVMLNLDRVWWKLRNVLDGDLDAAEDEIQAYKTANAAVLDYQQCHKSYVSLVSVYKKAMATTDRVRAKLKETWRIATNLIGELASLITDGEAFSNFMQEEGCNSSLAAQTIQQAALAEAGARTLLDRFETSGLKIPDHKTLDDALQRIESSYDEAFKSCEAAGGG